MGACTVGYMAASKTQHLRVVGAASKAANRSYCGIRVLEMKAGLTSCFPFCS